VVAVGADPNRIAILDNFCWPSVDDERTMGDLARTCEACYDAAKAYGIPFISGKDSLHNQFTNQETKEVIKIPNTLLISAIAVIEDVRKCVTMDLKRPVNNVMIVEPASESLKDLAALHRALAAAIASGQIVSCHDISDGGPIVAAAEMCIASGLGMSIHDEAISLIADLFEELPGRYLIELSDVDWQSVEEQIGHLTLFGQVERDGIFRIYRQEEDLTECSVDDLTRAWRGTLDW